MPERTRNEYVAFVCETLEPFGDVHARQMFGGWGLYHREVMFGLIAGDSLYLKVDEASVHWFRERGLPPFEYMKKGKPTKLSYYAAPEDVFDGPDEARLWASRAYEAALRAR